MNNRFPKVCDLPTKLQNYLFLIKMPRFKEFVVEDKIKHFLINVRLNKKTNGDIKNCFQALEIKTR